TQTRKNNKQQPTEELVYRPGPLTPIAPSTPGPETAEPSDNGTRTGAANNSLAERLKPGTFDPRLNPRASYVPYSFSPAEAVRARIAETLQEYNDSVSAEAEARRRGTDWTITTKDGKRWGISPGQLHL